jgi:cell division protein FtsI/penicillin-binding protein 2
LAVLRVAMALAFTALGVRLVFLQVVNHAHYAKLSVAEVKTELTTTALRGGIYDRRGQTLAVSRPTSLVIADDMQISHPASEARAMSPLVHVPVAKLTSLLAQKNHGYVIINNALALTDGKKVSSLVFPGIVVQNSSVRTYPDGTLATSILGGVNASVPSG